MVKNTACILLLFIAIVSFGCKGPRLAQRTALKPKSSLVLRKQLLENQVKAEWFSAKARFTYSDEYSRETFTSNIRIRKDSVIWMNFKKFSIEGARILITPDSVYVLDRLNGQYFIKPFDYVQKQYNLPVGFLGLQAILLGNPVFFSDEMTASVDSTRYLLHQKTEGFESKYWLDGAKMLLREFFVEDFRSRRTMTVLSSDYQSLEDKQNFSYFRTFNLNSPEAGSMKVDIEFSKVEINVPASFDFEIPSKYERIE